MLAVFCLRLALGLVASLLILSPAQVHPRFFRVHYLTSLGLLAVAGFFLREVANLWLGLFLAASVLFCLAGSVVWHVEGHPKHRVVLFFSAICLVASLVLGGSAHRGDKVPSWFLADDLTSAALLGSSTTAMLMGHSYLIAPAMSLAPLMRLLGGMAVALLVRVGLAGVGLWLWTGQPGPGTLETETMLWLPVRWLLGFVGPLVLGWMAWETARIRSTQSATGILYVVVIVCFLGELTSQLLVEKTGYIL